MKVFGLWERLTRIIFFDGQAVTVEPAPQTVEPKTITIPDVSPAATQEIVLSAQQQTLTNKTISGATNTLQAIPGASLNANSVTASKLNADVAGAGLVYGTDIAVNPDNTTVEVFSDQVRIKAQGVDTAQLKDLAVTNAKVATNAAIALTKLATGTASTVLKNDASGIVVSGNTIPPTGAVLTDSYANSGVVLKRFDSLKTYATSMSLTGTSRVILQPDRFGVIEITNSDAGFLEGINVANDEGAHLVLINKTSPSKTILVDNETLTVTETYRRIITGTGGPISLAPNASLFLVYKGDPSSTGRWYVVGGTGGGAGGTVTQVTTPTAHGFTAADKGKALYLNGSTYTAAIATASNTAEVVGILSSVIDTDTFELATGGSIEVISGDDFEGGSVPAKGTVVFLSDLTAGKMTATEPTVVGRVSKPLGIIYDTTKMFFYNMRGSVVGGANIRTQIAVNSAQTTTIQSVGSYTAGSLSGWIEWAATTPLKFYFQSQFAKNGAGTNYNIATQYVGDTPPLGFSVSITAAGDIQVTLPTIAGFTSGFANFSLQAPAVGTTLPITVAGNNVVSNYKNVTAAYTVTTNDYYISATGAAAYTISLPAASSVSGKMFVIKSRLNAGIILTIDPNGSETIDGALTRSLYQNEAVHIVSNGTSWEIF